MDALRRLDPRQRAARARRMRTRRAGGFHPMQIAAVKRIYSLEASTPVSGEYSSVVEMRGGSPLVQTSANRKPAASTSANGLPVAVFDGSDMWSYTLESGNNGTAKWFLAFRLNPSQVPATQHTWDAMTVGGSSIQRMQTVLTSTGTFGIDLFSSGFNGRAYRTVGTLTAGAWVHIYVAFDNSKTAEFDTDGATVDSKLRIAFGTTFQTITASDLGTGAAPASLQSATGTGMVGAANDSDTPVAPLQNNTLWGPYTYTGDAGLSDGELAAVVNFKVPT